MLAYGLPVVQFDPIQYSIIIGFRRVEFNCVYTSVFKLKHIFLVNRKLIFRMRN